MPIPKVRVGVERKAIMKKAITLLDWEKQSGYNYEYIKTSFELHIRYIVLYGIYFWILYTEGPLLISLSTLRDFGYVFELHRNGKVMRRLLFCEVFFSTSHYVCAKSLCPICLPNKKDEERLYIYRVCLQKQKNTRWTWSIWFWRFLSFMFACQTWRKNCNSPDSRWI